MLNRGFPKYRIKYGEKRTVAFIRCTYWYIPCEHLFEGDSFSSGWLQAKLIKEEFDVPCGGPSKAY